MRANRRPRGAARRDGPAVAAPGRRGPLLATVVVAAAVLAYANTWTNGLVHDDARLIPALPAVSDAKTLLGEGGWIGDPSLYRPVTLLSLALDAGINRSLGLEPAAAATFHVSNTGLHAVVALLLFVLLRSAGASAAAAAAAGVLFAVHPVHTEAVASPVGRAEILAAGLGFAFVALHRRGATAVAAAALALAVFAKESGIAFLAVAAAVEPWRPVRATGRRVAPWVLYAVTCAAALAWRATRVHPREIPFLDNPLAGLPFLDRLPGAIANQGRYLVLQLAPFRLSSDYSFDQIPVAGWGSPGPWLVLLAGAVATVLLWRARRSAPAAGTLALSYVALVAITSNVAFPTGTIFAERLAYAPSLAICAAAGLAFGEAVRRRPRAATAVLGIVFVALGAATFARNRTWSDPLTFYSEQVRTAPRSARAHFGLGYALAAAGDPAGAERSYRASIAIYPDHAPARYNLGNVLRESGAPADVVIEQYRQALRIDPGHRGALRNLARMLVEAGRWAEAEDVLRAMETLSPPHEAVPVLRRILESARPGAG